MPLILDSLITHLESKIISGQSTAIISSEVLADLYKDFQTVPVKQQAPLKPVIETAAVEKAVMPQLNPVIPVKNIINNNTLSSTEEFSLMELRNKSNTCSACHFALGEFRSQSVGLSENPQLMVITDPSGRTDEQMRDPFDGEAGELFLKMLLATKINLNDMYITLAHKCSAPNGREKWVETKPYLERQISLLKPKVILIFGGAALNILLGEQTLQNIRGKWLSILGIPAIATHPAGYLQKKPEAKKEAWSDIQQVMKFLTV